MQRRTTVLLVEENASVRDALEQAFKLENFFVLSFAHGREVIQNDPDYDVAVIDLNSRRNGNGLTTLRELSRLNPLLPIILISSYPELLNHPAAAHASARMLKPLEMPVLCRTVRDLTVLEPSCPLRDGVPNPITDRKSQPERCQ